MLTVARRRAGLIVMTLVGVVAAVIVGVLAGLVLGHRLSLGQGPPATSGPGVARVGFSCRLPVAGAVGGAGGFVHFPAAKFSDDPRSQVTYSGSRWLSSGEVPSPDGSAYAVAQFSQPGGVPFSTIIVAGPAGRRTAWVGAGYANLVSYTASSIYFMRVEAAPGALPALWSVDPSGSSPASKVSVQASPGAPAWQDWRWVNGGAAWGLSAATPGVPQTLTRLDLATGAVSVWLRQPGASVSVLGFDAHGHPVVEIATGGAAPALAEVALLTAPERGTRIYERGHGPRMPVPLNAVADRHGLWMGGADGSIWLYTASKGLQKVAEIPSTSSAAAFVRVAGPCG